MLKDPKNALLNLYMETGSPLISRRGARVEGKVFF